MDNSKFSIQNNNNQKYIKNTFIKNNLNNKYESYMFLKIDANNLNSKFHKIIFESDFIHNKITRINYSNFKKNLHIYGKKNDLYNNINIYEQNRIKNIFQDKFLFLHQHHQEIFFNSFIATLNYSVIARFMEFVYKKNTNFYSSFPQWYNCVLSSEKKIDQFITDTMLAETKLFLTYKKYNTTPQILDINPSEYHTNIKQSANKKKYMENNDFTIQKYINVSDTVLLYLITKCLNY